jgi:hypothetical protein
VDKITIPAPESFILVLSILAAQIEAVSPDPPPDPSMI